MPANWLYVIGGIIIGILAFTIAYNLVTVSIKQAQQQVVLSTFNDLYTDIETVCLQEINNSMIVKVKVPIILRVLYATDDNKNSLPTVTDRIKNKDISDGEFLCMQLKTEQNIRCQELTCETSIPYLGALETYNDLQLMVNRILGRALIKEYALDLLKTSSGVNVTVSR